MTFYPDPPPENDAADAIVCMARLRKAGLISRDVYVSAVRELDRILADPDPAAVSDTLAMGRAAE